MSEHAHDTHADVSTPRPAAGARSDAPALVGPPVRAAVVTRSAALSLQRLAGNRAVGSVLAPARPRRPEPPALQRADAPPAASETPERDVMAPAADTGGLAASIAAPGLARVADAEQAATARVTAAATALRARVEGAFAAATQRVDAGFGQLDGQARSGAQIESARVATESGAASSTLRGQSETAGAGAAATVGGLGAQSSAAAAEHADRARSEVSAAHDRAVPQPGGAPDEEVEQGRRRITDAVDGKAATELATAGDRAAASITSGERRFHDELYQPAQADAQAKIKQAAARADAAVTEGAGTAQAAVGRLTQQAASGAADARATVGHAFTSGRQSALDELAAGEARGHEAVAATAQRFRTEILAGAAQFEADAQAARPDPAALAAGWAEVEEGAGRTTDEMAAALAGTAEDLGTGLGRLVDQHLDAVTASADQAGRYAEELGRTVRGEQRRAVDGFTATADAATGEAGAQFAAAPDQLAGALAGPHQIAQDGLRAKADETGASASGWADRARNAGERGTADLDTAAASLAREAARQQPQVQGWFEELVGGMRHWLQDHLGNVLGGIVSGIVLSIPALLVAGALILAGPVGWGVLAALFVVGAGMGIYSRWREYQSDHGGQGPSGWDALGVIGLGIADVTGIPYIVEAAVGRRAFSSTPMTEFERWERGTQGVISLALVVAGGAKKLFGRGAPEAPLVRPEGAPVAPKTAPGPTPGETPAPAPVDPARVEFPAGTAYEKFQWVRQQIMAAPPGQRLQVARSLLGRMPAETGNAWSAQEHPATNGVYWTGEKQGNIFFIDDAGNVYSGRASVETFTYGPNGAVTVNAASLTAAPAPAPAPPPPPAHAPPAAPTAPAAPPAGDGVHRSPGVPIPAPRSSDDRRPALR